MILYPNAKINLGLHVLNKRIDGFHEIESCLYPIHLKDILEIIPSDKFEFIQTGIAFPSSTEKNLCEKAFDLLAIKFKLPPVYMHLRKQIPAGAGLGGGSSDASFVLKGLNDLFSLNLVPAQLEDFAAQLGSDCPFFVANQPCIVSGRGEVLAPLSMNLAGTYLVLINPGIHVSTKEAYALVVPKKTDTRLQDVLLGNKKEWSEKLINDFQIPISNKHPIVGHTIEALFRSGAFYAAMSGSGSTVFGLFDFKPDFTPLPFVKPPIFMGWI